MSRRLIIYDYGEIPSGFVIVEVPADTERFQSWKEAKAALDAENPS